MSKAAVDLDAGRLMFISYPLSILRVVPVIILAAFLVACGGGSSPNFVSSGSGGGETGGGGTPSAHYYVAPNGNDSYSGTLAEPNSGNTDGPFKTLTKAQQVVESEKSSVNGSITIEIRAGTYYLSAPLSFTSADSGSASQQITWEGYPGDPTPVISGGQQVTGWTNVSGNTWTAQIPSSYSNFEALYYNGQRRYRPRTTQSGYLFLNPVVMSSPQTNCTENYPGGYRCSDRFSFTPGDLSANYHEMNDVEIVSFEDWTVSRMRLQSVDTANDIAYLTGNVPGAEFFGFIAGHRFLVDNVKESLSQPGQWYLDRGASPWTLTYLAKSGENPGKDTVIVPQQPQVLVANGLQYVKFSDLQFSHDNYTVPMAGHPGNSGETNTPAAISVHNSSNVTFDSVTIAHTQGWGLEFVGTASAGAGNTVTGSLVYDTGAGGIRIGQLPSSADSDATVAQNNTVTESMIFSGGRFLPGGEGTGIWIGSSHHNTISHDDVHDFYNGAIELGQSPSGAQNFAHDNSVEFDKLYDLGQGVTSDMGCVHVASGNNTGNQFVNNICHDVTHDQSSGGYGGNGIYLDSNAQNLTVKDNIIYRVSDTALFLNTSSSGNTITNNIFAYGREGMIRRGISGSAGSFKATNNIFYYDMGSLQRLPSIWVCSSGCTSQFTLDYNDYWATNGSVTFVTTVSNDPSSVSEQFDLASWQALTGEDVHSVAANPEFMAPGSPSDDYGLMSGSPASSSEGFMAISTDQVGPTMSLSAPSSSVPAAFPLELLQPSEF